MAIARPVDAPLYDPRYEHDACGVGFVADAGGRSAGRVLTLALAGLGSLGHRGAFAADGASSDGAGIAIPLEPDVLARSLLACRADPGSSPSSRPRRPGGRAAARAIVERALADERLPAPAWRTVPSDPSVLGREAAASRPAFLQAIVERPAGLSDTRFERRLVLARRRMETAARPAGTDLAGFAVPSASSRTIVYKGLVAGDRLAALYPDLGPDLAVSHAVFHQRYATNTVPDWRLAQPFRSLAHNGEINTVRGNREQVRGRAGDRVERPDSVTARLLGAGPLLSPGGSDSLSLDEALELLVLTGWSLDAALLALVPEAPAMRATGHPLVTAFGAPGGRAHRAVGRPGRDRLRRRPPGRRARRSERAASDGLRGDRRPAGGGRVRGRGCAARSPMRWSGEAASVRASSSWWTRVAGRSSRTSRPRRTSFAASWRPDAPRAGHLDLAENAAAAVAVGRPRPDAAALPGSVSTPSGPVSTSGR